MNLILLKTVLAFAVLGLGVASAVAMLSLLGRAKPPEKPAGLRSTHRVAGYLFLLVVVVLAVLGATILRGARDSLPTRGVLHWVLGSLLVFVLLLKIVLVRYYKKFQKAAPALGLSLLVLAFLVAMISAGYVLITGDPRLGFGGVPEDVAGSVSRSVEDAPEGQDESAEGGGDIALGRSVFEANCAGCHLSDSTAKLVGPGLAGLFEQETLETTGHPVTRRSVRQQILDPPGTMPSFEGEFSEDQVDGLLAYLEGL